MLWSFYTCLYMFVHHINSSWPQRSEEPLVLGWINGQLWSARQVLDPNPMQEQQVPLTVDSSLCSNFQHFITYILLYIYYNTHTYIHTHLWEAKENWDYYFGEKVRAWGSRLCWIMFRFQFMLPLWVFIIFERIKWEEIMIFQVLHRRKVTFENDNLITYDQTYRIRKEFLSSPVPDPRLSKYWQLLQPLSATGFVFLMSTKQPTHEGDIQQWKTMVELESS